MSLVAGSGAHPGPDSPAPATRLRLTTTLYTSFQAAVNHNDLCRRQRARESERESE